MPVSSHVVGDLCRFHGHAHGVHECDDPLVGEDGVGADDYAVGSVLVCGLVVPLGLLELGDGVPGVWVDVEDVPEHVLGVGGEHLGLLVLAAHDLLVEFVGVLVLKGEVAAEHGVEDDAAGPDVDAGALVAPARDHLGRSVARGPAGRFEPFARLVLVGQSEVHDLDVALVVEKQVLRLQVPVHDPVLVDVLHSR